MSLSTDPERFRTALKQQLAQCRRQQLWGEYPCRVLKGYLFMTPSWAGFYRITRAGTYRCAPVLSQYCSELHGIRHNEGLVLYENKEEAIQALKAYREVLAQFDDLEPRFLRLDRVWLEDSLLRLGLPCDCGGGPGRHTDPDAGYILYLYASW